MVERQKNTALIEIESNFLRLIPLDNRLLTIWNTEGRHQMEIILGLNPSDWEVDFLHETETKNALQNFWIPQTHLNPDNFYWYSNWEIVLIETNSSIGGIGFAGFPEKGSTVIGYTIDKKFHNRGFATEALNCLLDWAFMDPTLKIVLADTPIDNYPSQKVLIKNGFKRIGEGVDEDTQTIQVYHWAKNRP
ncbi:MAG: GNAT family N-acetyltransferase [Bacteroidota bacterium]